MTSPLQQPIPEGLAAVLRAASEASAARRTLGEGFTPTAMREALAGMTERFVTDVPPVAEIRECELVTRDHPARPIPVRIYHPEPGTHLPVLVFAHGGGHMAGSVAVYDAIARKLALASHRVLVSVDYRLSPEYPYPAGLLDLEAVIRQVFGLLAEEGMACQPRLAVAGDSGGGAITASAVQRLGDEPGTCLEHQVLIYPSLDYTLSQPSIRQLASGYLLERERIEWLFDQYLAGEEDRRAVSPLFMPLPTRMPDSLIVTAGWCPLRDEGLAYLARLREAGHRAEGLHLPDMLHAFANLEDVVPEACDTLYRGIGQFLGD